MGTALAGLVMLGLAVVYLLGVDAWEKTSTRINLQRTASSVVYEITRDIQRADSLEIIDGGKVLYCRIPPFEMDSQVTVVTYSLDDVILFKESNGLKSMIVPSRDHDSLRIEIIEGLPLFQLSNQVPTSSRERVVDINFTIVHSKNKVDESMDFSTVVGARNL